jgi:hypothetical protein
MIVSNLDCGLGNQLFQYAVGRQLSIKKGVELKLSIINFKHQNLRSFKLDKYNIKAEIATDQDIDKFLRRYYTNSLSSKLYRNLEKLLPRNQRSLFKETDAWTFESTIFNSASNIFIEGFWQNYKYVENLSPLIFEELTVKETYNINIQKIIQDVQFNASSVSLHIRRGDYVTDKDANERMGVLSLDYYYKAMDYIKKNIENPLIYVFSDDLLWAKHNLKTDLPLMFIDIENGKLDYVELDIMSKCSHNIIANSSFSWWGAFLNRNPNKIVIAPKSWVAIPEINEKIEVQLPAWLKL